MNIKLLVLLSAALLLSLSLPVQATASADSLKRLQIGLIQSGPNAPPNAASRNFGPTRRPSLLDPVVFVMAFHTIGMGMLVSMDPEETGFKPMHVRNWAEGMKRPPIWDNDSNITNYILHPLWGSETYLRARTAGYEPLQSFLFSTAASVLWEYGFESWAEHPSIQDLLVTSTAGSLIGEARYRARLALLNRDEAWAAVLLILLDPLGTLFSETTKLVGGAAERIPSGIRVGGSLNPALPKVTGPRTGGRFGLTFSVGI